MAKNKFPRYEVGDLVRVLPYKDIKEQFDHGDRLPSGCHFVPEMERYCERSFIIDHIRDLGNDFISDRDDGIRFISDRDDGIRYYFKEVDIWCFTQEMIELVIDGQPVDVSMSYKDLVGEL